MLCFRSKVSHLMIQKLWAEHKKALLRTAILIMLVAALVWLGYEFWRLWQPRLKGAVDLKHLHRFTQDWFSGKPVYRERSSVYPPATYAILWPLLGWLTLPMARWIYAASAMFALAWCIGFVVRECRAAGFLERAFAALIPCSMYATGAAIGNGQFTVQIIAALASGLVMTRRDPRGWHARILMPALILMAFIKPSIAVFFFWILLFVPDSPRPALLVMSGYISLTLFAAAFQEGSLVTLTREWLIHASHVGNRGGGTGNVANLHIWLTTFGLREWSLPVSMVVLLALGLWIYSHRRVELWLLLAVTAYVARIGTYHRWYEDLLILLPMVAFFRIAKERSSSSNTGILAGILLAATMLASLAPGGLFLFPAPWNSRYVAGQVVVWVAGLVFLLRQAWVERRKISFPLTDFTVESQS